MVYIAGLDVHEFLRRSPISHAKGVESIVWLTTFAGVYRGFRSHAKGRRHGLQHAKHGLPHANSDTGIPQPPGGTGNIGEKLPTPLLVRILSPVAHAAIIAGPSVYLIGTAWGGMEQPEWFSNWALRGLDLDVGPFAALRTLACVANFGLLYFLKRTREQIHAVVRSHTLKIPTSLIRWSRLHLRNPPSRKRVRTVSSVTHWLRKSRTSLLCYQHSYRMYRATLLNQVAYALMWWNAIPLATAAVTTAYLAFQLPYEVSFPYTTSQQCTESVV